MIIKSQKEIHRAKEFQEAILKIEIQKAM